MKIFFAIIVIVVVTAAGGWAQSNQVMVVTNAPVTIVVTNNIRNLPIAPPLPAPATNDLVAVTNSIPVMPSIDTNPLVKQFTGTDAVTKEKVNTAIVLIQTGEYAQAAESLREVLSFTAMTPDQEQAIRGVLNQLPY